jgi:hypothetical protein
MSTRVEGGTVLVTVTAHATLSAGTAHLSLTAREGPAPGTWRYNLSAGTDNRAHSGRIAGMTGHMDVLRYAAGVCAAGYQPGTIERGLLEQFAATGEHQRLGPPVNARAAVPAHRAPGDGAREEAAGPG